MPDQPVMPAIDQLEEIEHRIAAGEPGLGDLHDALIARIAREEAAAAPTPAPVDVPVPEDADRG